MDKAAGNVPGSPNIFPIGAWKWLVVGEKVDLDAILALYIMGIRPWYDIRVVSGSATGAELADSRVLCIEVGGSGRVEEGNFDHHGSSGVVECASRQAWCIWQKEQEQRARILNGLVDYVGLLDEGHRRAESGQVAFPSLTQLFSGMLLSVRKPEEQIQQGLLLIDAAVRVGLNPFLESGSKLFEVLDSARLWAATKRAHEKNGEAILANATWLTSREGRRVAVIETTWFGAPGALQGAGADLVIALNPRHCVNVADYFRKFTVAAHREAGISVLPALPELNQLELGWDGPGHGTIIGSPRGKSSCLSMSQVVAVVFRQIFGEALQIDEICNTPEILPEECLAA